MQFTAAPSRDREVMRGRWVASWPIFIHLVRKTQRGNAQSTLPHGNGLLEWGGGETDTLATGV